MCVLYLELVPLYKYSISCRSSSFKYSVVQTSRKGSVPLFFPHCENTVETRCVVLLLGAALGNPAAEANFLFFLCPAVVLLRSESAGLSFLQVNHNSNRKEGSCHSQVLRLLTWSWFPESEWSPLIPGKIRKIYQVLLFLITKCCRATSIGDWFNDAADQSVFPAAQTDHPSLGFFLSGLLPWAAFVFKSGSCYSLLLKTVFRPISVMHREPQPPHSFHLYLWRPGRRCVGPLGLSHGDVELSFQCENSPSKQWVRGKLEARDAGRQGISGGILQAWLGRQRLRSQDLSHLISMNHQLWLPAGAYHGYCRVSRTRTAGIPGQSTQGNKWANFSSLITDIFFVGTVGTKQI